MTHLPNDLSKLLQDYAARNTPSEPAFDHLVNLAIDIFGVPMAAIAFPDDDRISFKSSRGLPSTNVDRHGSFCDVAIRADEPLIVQNAADDIRFRSHPFVSGPPGIRFYVGVPLFNQGLPVGVLSIMSTVSAGAIEEAQLRRLRELGNAIEEILELRLGVMERDRAQARLRILDLALSRAKDVVMVTEAEPLDEPGPRIVYINSAFTDVTGYSVEEVIGKSPRFLQGPETDRIELDRIRAALKARQVVEAELVNYRKDGSQFWVELNIVPVLDEAGQATHFVSVQRDISAWKKLDEQSRKTERLESLQRLAGGIAHNFNNLLTIVLGYGHLLLESAPSQEAREEIQAILEAANKAARISSGLRDFSRHTPAAVQTVNLNQFIKNLEPALRNRVLGQHSLRIELAPQNVHVRIAPEHLDAAIMRLLDNALEAMPDVGTVTIQTGLVVIEPESEHLKLIPGEYATLTVIDTGVGMSPGLHSRLFEPFFSTKGTGRGTGLSTVYGMITSAGGDVVLDSRPGVGTTATIYLPVVLAEPASEP